ncbi:MAG: enoyl-ACP reductase [Allomuricauda sp.]
MGKWALIIGGSSGLGLATAQKFAAHDFKLIVLHRDRKTDMGQIEKVFQEIAQKTKLFHFNVDATNPEKRKDLLRQIQKHLVNEKIGVVVHSIAKGNLKPMQNDGNNTLDGTDFRLTIDAMAISLYDWVKLLADSDVFTSDSRIIAYTSEGSSKAWKNYAAISAAKASLEAIVRNIALEFADMGIRANCIQAGITDTKSFRMIPNCELLKNEALKRNPNNRLTEPMDVANVAYLLTLEEAKWITGTVIKVDGGESLR